MTIPKTRYVFMLLTITFTITVGADGVIFAAWYSLGYWAITKVWGYWE